MKSFIIMNLLLLSCVFAYGQNREINCVTADRLYDQADTLLGVHRKGEFKPKPNYTKALNKLYSARVAARNCKENLLVKKIDARILAISTKVDSLRQAAEKATQAAKKAARDAERAAVKAMNAENQSKQEKENAVRAKLQADTSARLTEASRLITLAAQFEQDDPTLALQLIKKACDTSYFKSDIAVQELQTVLSKTHPVSYYRKKIEDTSAIVSTVVSANGQRLITGHNDGTLSIWNKFDQLSDGQPELVTVTTPHKGAILSLAVSTDGKRIVSGGIDGLVCLWDDQRVQRIVRSGKMNSPVLSVALSANGRYVVSSHEDRSVTVWDSQSGDGWGNQLILTSGNAVQVCFSPDNRYVGMAGNDETVRVWDWQHNQQVALLEEHRGAVRSVAFSPDGRYIVSGGDDKTVRVWEWQLRSVSLPAPVSSGHQQPVLSVAFSPVTNIFVSAGQDKTIKVWTFANNTITLLHTLRGHQKPVFATGFLANGSFLYSGSSDHSVKLWDWRQTRLADSLHSDGLFPTTPPTVTLTETSGRAGQRSILSQPVYHLTLPANLQKPGPTFVYSSDQSYILIQDNEAVSWLWDYNQTSRPVFSVLTSGTRLLRLSSDDSRIQAGRYVFRNLYHELKNDQLIPKMTDGDRARYLLPENGYKQ